MAEEPFKPSFLYYFGADAVSILACLGMLRYSGYPGTIHIVAGIACLGAAGVFAGAELGNENHRGIRYATGVVLLFCAIVSGMAYFSMEPIP